MGSKGHRHRGPARWGTPLPPRPHLSEDRPDQRGQALGPRLPLDWLCRLQRHRRQVSQEEHGVQGCPIPPPACSWPPGGPPHRQMPPSTRSALPSPALPVPARPSGQTFCGPCKAVPLCSLPCGLGRMVGGKVQMGPCSPSSASASLEGKAGSPRPWGPAPRPPPAPGARPERPPTPAPGTRRPLHVRVLRAGLLAVALRPPALVAVDELGEEGGLLGVARDELVLQQLLGGGPLRDRRGGRALGWASAAPPAAARGAWAPPPRPLGGPPPRDCRCRAQRAAP